MRSQLTLATLVPSLAAAPPRIYSVQDNVKEAEAGCVHCMDAHLPQLHVADYCYFCRFRLV